MQHTNRNKTRAARLLGFGNPTTLTNRLRKQGVERRRDVTCIYQTGEIRGHPANVGRCAARAAPPSAGRGRDRARYRVYR